MTSVAIPSWVPSAAWAGYVEMRKKKRAVMTDRAVELKIKALAAFHADGQDVGAILDQSTENGWTDIYPLRERRSVPRSPQMERLGKKGQATANNALDWLEGK